MGCTADFFLFPEDELIRSTKGKQHNSPGWTIVAQVSESGSFSSACASEVPDAWVTRVIEPGPPRLIDPDVIGVHVLGNLESRAIVPPSAPPVGPDESAAICDAAVRGRIDPRVALLSCISQPWVDVNLRSRSRVRSA